MTGLRPEPAERDDPFNPERGESDRSPVRLVTANVSFAVAPIPRTRLIGRGSERELAREYLLERRTPLLTLSGPGGVGKTRLVIAIGEDVRTAFAGGVVWCDLEAIVDPEFVALAIAAAVGLSLPRQRPPGEAIARHLMGRPILLLLNNCEHLIAASAALIASLLSWCPELQVLATSRAPFRIRGEHILPIGPLHSDAAVCLFIERAQAVQPGFVLDPATERTVTEVCARLDNLPLAIELAAARSRMMSPGTLLAEMPDRLHWLRDGARDLPPRQRTMRDTIAWSYELLQPDEQCLFRWLSVLAGGCTLAAARDLCRLLDGGAIDPTPVLTALVDQELLQYGGSDTAPRFSMLETIRDFGNEQLLAHAEAEHVRSAHAEVYLAFAEQHHPNRIDPQERVDARVQRIEAELANLRAALIWFDQQQDGHGLLRMTAALAVYWHVRTHFHEAHRWLERALEATEGNATVPRARALGGLALILWAESSYERATEAACQSLSIAERCGDLETEANALHVLGMIAEIQDQWGEAETHLTRVRDQWRVLGAQVEEAWSLSLLCRVALGQGNLSLAVQYAEDALVLFRATGYSTGTALALSRLGEVSRARGMDRTAATAFHEALQLWLSAGERWLITLALGGLADLAAVHGQPQTAASLVGYLDALACETAAPLLSAALLSRDRALRVATSHLGEVTAVELLSTGQAMSLEEAVALAATVSIASEPYARSTAVDPLTSREREILQLMAEMHTDQEIADLLSLSRRTVNGHVMHVLAKLRAPNRRAAVGLARRLGLLADSDA